MIPQDLFEWYEPRRAAYPWRTDPPDPYRVWVSEVMLQQTQASRVASVFERFVERFPNVTRLARAPRSDVVRAWGGLGYNRRAVALSDTAREVVARHGGVLPTDIATLMTLPGIGSYTASAIASIGFGAPVPACDTNVLRVVARWQLGSEPHLLNAADVRRAAAGQIDRGRPGDWNQAVMDLGRTICRPAPLCDVCPLATDCRFRASDGKPERSVRRQGPFEGSARQLRGRIVALLRTEPSAPLASITEASERTMDQVATAVRQLVAEGMIDADDAAMRGELEGRVRLSG